MSQPYRLLLMLPLVLFGPLAQAQLVINTGSTPQQLVQNVLIGGGVSVSNIQYTGANTAIGFFDGSSSNIGLGSGVLLCTGLATGAIGPNNSINDPGTDHGLPGDANLSNLSGSLFGTYDACILEFDFIPQNDSLSFNYVFASNEYMLFVGSGVNDVFAFFISGPGIVGEENIALIPGSTVPVAIDNVNANSNPQYYISNENPAGQSVEYNGWTTKFTANAVVQACQTYHIRLAIADGGDGQYDSGVFLEAGSFSTPVLTVSGLASYSVVPGQNDMVEGCGQVVLTFERDGDLSQPLSVGLSTTGTATPGVDCSAVPASVNFGAWQSQVSLTININSDALAEAVETLTISMANVNPCAGSPPPSVSFSIQDHPGLNAIVPADTTIACPTLLIYNGTSTGGIGTIGYTWQGGSIVGAELGILPLQTTTYNLLATDACGVQATNQFTVSIPGYVPMTITAADGVVCQGEEVTLSASATGGAGALQITWGSEFAPGPTVVVSPAQAQNYVATATDSCGITASATAHVAVTVANAQEDHAYINNNTLQFSAIVDAGAAVTWVFGDGDSAIGLNVQHTFSDTGHFEVMMLVIDANGCQTSVPIEVIAYPELRVYVPSAFTPNGDGLNDVFGPRGEGYLHFDMAIYDRWGQNLYETFGTRRGWTGQFEGKPVPGAMYSYRITVHPAAGESFEKIGAVHLVR